MIRVLAAAKINLYLDVIRRREDGYHDIETLYQPVGLWDELSLEEGPRGVELAGDEPALAWNEENLCYRAARAALGAAGETRGVRITVAKGIPPGAGLGGGSADAAATLLAVDRLFGLGLSEARLLALALELGSDVPFFIRGAPAIGRGRGEILEETSGLPDGWILIVKPDVTISTKWAYQNLNLVLTKGEGKATLTALVRGLAMFPEARLETHNSFEAGVVRHFPSVGEAIAALRRERPILCSLSGSGSACFAVFEERRKAEAARGRLSESGFFAKVVQPVDRAIRFA